MNEWNCHQCGSVNPADKVICARCGAIKRVELPGLDPRGELFTNPGIKLLACARWLFYLGMASGAIIMIVIWSTPIGHGFPRFLLGLGEFAGSIVLSYLVSLLLAGFGELITRVKYISDKLDR